MDVTETLKTKQTSRQSGHTVFKLSASSRQKGHNTLQII